MTGDGHFVCLHDLTLDRETTGTGPVAAVSRDDLMRLRYRGAGGAALDEPLLFLDEIVAAIGRLQPPFKGSVQLDLKDPGEQFGHLLIGRLHRMLGEHIKAFIASACDPELVARLGTIAPEIPRGFDPLEVYAGRPPATAAAFEDLAETTLQLAPRMRVYYLEANLILAGLNWGVNLVERVGAGGAEIDAWTVDAGRPRLQEDLDRLTQAGCHQITTNDPRILEPMLR